jgi:hypothetical protein
MEGERPEWLRWLRRLVALALLAGIVLVVRAVLKGDDRVRGLGTEVCLLQHRLSVLNYWDVKGALPPYLEDTLSVRGASIDARDLALYKDRGRQAMDRWGESLLYAKDPDGRGFEIRSAGPDRRAGTADDLVQKGVAGEDRTGVFAELENKRHELDAATPRRSRRR